MKHVVSVSLGSSRGDFERTVRIDDHDVNLKRLGTDGNYDKALEIIAELDGHVDAIGLGGIDIYLEVNRKRFVIGDGQRLANAARRTPVVDGSGLKNTLERRVVDALFDSGRVTESSRVLLVGALDRFGMAEAFVERGCPCVFGDLIFTIGLDFPLTRLDEIDALAEKYRKRLETVPFHLLYPTGASQDDPASDPIYSKYYVSADVIAGDAHLITKHLPTQLDGPGIITNTTRPHTVAKMRDAGVAWLATTTPNFDGVSAGTNLIEAALVSIYGDSTGEIGTDRLREILNTLRWTGSVSDL